KNLIDVVVYRGSDALHGWVFDGLQTLGLKLGTIALVALPCAAGWLALSLALGRAQEHRAASIDSEAAEAKHIDDGNLGDAGFGFVSEVGVMTGEPTRPDLTRDDKSAENAFEIRGS